MTICICRKNYMWSRCMLIGKNKLLIYMILCMRLIRGSFLMQ